MSPTCARVCSACLRLACAAANVRERASVLKHEAAAHAIRCGRYMCSVPAPWGAHVDDEVHRRVTSLADDSVQRGRGPVRGEVRAPRLADNGLANNCHSCKHLGAQQQAPHGCTTLCTYMLRNPVYVYALTWGFFCRGPCSRPCLPTRRMRRAGRHPAAVALGTQTCVGCRPRHRSRTSRLPQHPATNGRERRMLCIEARTRPCPCGPNNGWHRRQGSNWSRLEVQALPVTPFADAELHPPGPAAAPRAC